MACKPSGHAHMHHYYLHLYDTSGRRVTRGSLRISATDDLEALAETAAHGPSDVYRAVLIDGRRIVAEWSNRKSTPRKCVADLLPADGSA